MRAPSSSIIFMFLRREIRTLQLDLKQDQPFSNIDSSIRHNLEVIQIKIKVVFCVIWDHKLRGGLIWYIWTLSRPALFYYDLYCIIVIELFIIQNKLNQ